VVVVNNLFKPEAGLAVEATVLDASGATTFHEVKQFDAAADSATRTLTIPAEARAAEVSFVRLLLRDASGAVVSQNTYWLAKKQTEFDWAKTDYTHTPPSSFEDFSALKHLSPAKVTARVLPAGPGEAMRIELHNAAPGIAFQVALAGFESGGKPYDSLLWSDNFIELLPGERRVLTATALRPETVPALHVVKLTGWNFEPLSIKADAAIAASHR